jgi:UDP-N-acetylglucosamine 2-epimerase (non-hydrolysing)
MSRLPKVLCVVGARPNFIKASALVRQFSGSPRFQFRLVHTGQHHDEKLSGQFFRELEIPHPDVNLGVGSASHAVQTARVMEAFEPVLAAEKPDVVLVIGDVNSTIACALTAVKMGIRVAHVEAGLRSFDRAMPEEINRILTDAISDILYTTEESANQNLRNEGVSADRVEFVGNVMIDTLLTHRDKARASDVLQSFDLQTGAYGLVTLHRPANVDCPQSLRGLVEAIGELAQRLPILFPCHPRTLAVLEDLQLPGLLRFEGPASQGVIRICPPLGYLDFVKLMSDARLVLTDSGGIQEETTILGVPCLTLRENTERPVTVTHGTNEIVGTSPAAVVAAGLPLIDQDTLVCKPLPPLWDGNAAQRIADNLALRLGLPEEAA